MHEVVHIFLHFPNKYFPPHFGTIIGIPGLILCANTPGKDDNHESFAIICDKAREHIWRDVWPFLLAEYFRIIDILGIPPSSVLITGISWMMAIAEHGSCFYLTISVWILMCSMLGVIVLRDNLPTTKTLLPIRGKQIFCQDFLVELIVPLIWNITPWPIWPQLWDAFPCTQFPNLAYVDTVQGCVSRSLLKVTSFVKVQL